MKKMYYPFCIQIELVQGCNRECRFCGTNGIERKIHKAEAATIAHTGKLLKNFGYKGRILIAGHGEPTLHPNIAECIKIIRRELPNNHITIFTNGYGILNGKVSVHDLFKAGTDAIMFDEYADNRIGIKVRELPEINQYLIEDLKPGTHIFEKTKQKRIIIAPPIDGDYQMMSRKLCNHCGAGMPPAKHPQQNRCSIIFRDFFVRYDGGIAICCNDFRGEYPVTNIMDCNTFEEAYYHPRLEAARKRLMLKDRAFEPCSKCNVSPIRPGLLPENSGKYKMPEPTAQDYEITQRRMQPMAIIRKREWE